MSENNELCKYIESKKITWQCSGNYWREVEQCKTMNREMKENEKRDEENNRGKSQHENWNAGADSKMIIKVIRKNQKRISNKLCNNIGRKRVKGLEIGDTIHTTNYVLVVSFRHRREKRRGVKTKKKKEDLDKRRNRQIEANESKNWNRTLKLKELNRSFWKNK